MFCFCQCATIFASDEMNAFDKFPLLPGLKPYKGKCEIADIGVLKWVSLALCGMDCIGLTKKKVGICFFILKVLKLKRTLSYIFGK